MNRKLKALGLALVAALALTAVMANTASAQFTSNKTHTIISGSQEGNTVFTAGSGFGGIKCASVTVSGTWQNTSESDMVLTTATSGCTESFGRTVHEHTTETDTHTTGVLKGAFHKTGTKTRTVTSGGTTICTIKEVTPQTDNGVTYDNLGGTNGVRITYKVTNVRTTTSGGFFNCGIIDGEHKEGTYEGTIVITSKDTTGAAAEIKVD
jgi:hypothetical protein